MSIREVNGDVIAVARTVSAEAGCEVLLPHVCNNVGVMGAGVALHLATTFPGVDTEYKQLCHKHRGQVLGRTVVAHVKPHLFVMNMIAQEGFAKIDGMPPLRYSALVHCMEDVFNLANKHSETGVKTAIVCPRFGAGLAGGNWSVIRQLIVELWASKGVAVVITTYKE